MSVIAIYDIRGIQDYIFRTNTLKEITGGSELVKNLLIDEFKNVVRSIAPPDEELRLEWDLGADFEFDENPQVSVEILYCGGGNLVAAFRSAEMCQKVDKALAIKILKRTYSLNLAVAAIEKTDDYPSDWLRLRGELDRIKAAMPMVRPAGCLPVTAQDKISGMPLSESRDGRMVSYESARKRDAYNAYLEASQKAPYLYEFDRMVFQKDEESLLAIVHVDGNGMGKMIADSLKGQADYKSAVARMREISRNIESAFNQYAFSSLEQFLLSENIKQKLIREKILKENEFLPFRPVVNAGDDVTFVCNARIALPLAEHFLREVAKYDIHGEIKEGVGFTACAGIAFIHSHFPFSKGYEIAEACCSAAKKRAKSPENLVNGRPGSYLDFHVIFSGMRKSLAEARKEHYFTPDHKQLLLRPYQIIGTGGKPFDFSCFKAAERMLKSSSFPRSWAKSYRDAYFENDARRELLCMEAESRGHELGKMFENDVAVYYDALETMDFYCDLEVE